MSKLLKLADKQLGNLDKFIDGLYQAKENAQQLAARALEKEEYAEEQYEASVKLAEVLRTSELNETKQVKQKAKKVIDFVNKLVK